MRPRATNPVPGGPTCTQLCPLPVYRQTAPEPGWIAYSTDPPPMRLAAGSPTWVQTSGVPS